MKKNIAIFLLNAYLIACCYFIITQTSEHKQSRSYRTDQNFAVVQFDKLSQANEDTKFQSYTAHKNAGIKTAVGMQKNFKGRNSTSIGNGDDAVFESLPVNLLDASNSKSIAVKANKGNQNGYNYTYFGQKTDNEFPNNSGSGASADNFASSSKSINLLGQGNFNYSFTRSLAYNNLTSPKLTLDNNLDNEDPFNEGNGNDNESYYNDVPVGDGTIVLIIMALVFVGWKRWKNIAPNP